LRQYQAVAVELELWRARKAQRMREHEALQSEIDAARRRLGHPPSKSHYAQVPKVRQTDTRNALRPCPRMDRQKQVG
jgi:hypothetical protein